MTRRRCAVTDSQRSKTGGRLVDLVVQARTDSVICACCDLVEANGGTEVADCRRSRAEEVIVPLTLLYLLHDLAPREEDHLNGSYPLVDPPIIELQASSMLSRFPSIEVPNKRW